MTTSCLCFQAFHLLLTLEGDFRKSPQWKAIKPRKPNILQSTSRFVRQLTGIQSPAPSPSEVLQPAACNGEMYRMMRERMARLRGDMDR